jgi:glucokinase
MLIAGDIGATRTRLALVSGQIGPREYIAEQEFHTADYRGLQPVTEAFLANNRGPGRLCLLRCRRAGEARAPDKSSLGSLTRWRFAAASRSARFALSDLHAIVHGVPHPRPESTRARPYRSRRSP